MSVKLSKSEEDGIIAQIARESNGDAGVTQNSALKDGNSGANLAQGLLQYVPSTFKSYAKKGHTNIKSGYDQLLAFFNNSNWRRDLPYGKSGWGPSGHRRFATGGVINENGMYNLAEDGHSEVVVPLDPNRATDAMKLITYAQSKIKGKKNKRPSQMSNLSSGESESNGVLEMMARQLQATQEQNKILMKLLNSSKNIEDKPTGFNEQVISDSQGRRANKMKYYAGGAF